MGFSFSNIWSNIIGKKYNILMLGLDAAGKTTILNIIRKEKTLKKTNHYNGRFFYSEESLDYNDMNLISWDIGSANFPKYIYKLYQNTDGIIFVLDSHDRDRDEDAYDELKLILEEIKDCPILIMANKQDLNSALTPFEVKEKLEMEKLKDRIWLVQGTSAITGQGIEKSFDWMISILNQKINK